MKMLKLTLKKQYFDQIISGEKLEEYREVKKHWISRLITNKFTARDYKNENNIVDLIFQNKEHYSKNRIEPFDFVEFTNGYSVNSPKVTLEFKGIEIRTGNPNWGAEKDKLYFVIKLGKVISRLNC
jgi:hypothetical protein